LLKSCELFSLIEPNSISIFPTIFNPIS
jgi:hypothetical protein